jgi:tetratricopeptide (TPR) repeat protein
LAVTTKDERELKLKTILSTIKYSLDVYAIEKTEDFTILCDLAGNAWMCIAILNDMMGAYGTSVLANEAAVDFYLGLNDGNESNSVLKRAVATFMLASEYSKVDEKEKALKLYRASLNYIRDLDGDDTLEAAAISVYIGVKDYSVEHLEGALKIYKEKAHLTRESYYPGMGQEAILLKYMAMRKYQKSEFKIAFSSISSAITIFERVRVPAGQSLLKPPTTLKDVFLAAEDWDLHLLESYVIALQIAHRNEYVVDAFDIIKKIAVLFGEIEQFKQSFQCLYSLFLNLRRSNGDDDLTVANLLFNMSNLVGKANIGMGSALFHEEFIRITVATLGPNHPELIPSILHLGRLMLKSGQYEDALKWTDIGLSALEAMNSWGKDTMLLTLVKVSSNM